MKMFHTSLSPMQLVDLWSQLESSYYNKNTYAGNECEIYAHTLLPWIPRVTAGHPESVDAAAQCAAQALQSVLEYFIESKNCAIWIDGVLFSDYVKPIHHRIHIKVVPI